MPGKQQPNGIFLLGRLNTILMTEGSTSWNGFSPAARDGSGQPSVQRWVGRNEWNGFSPAVRDGSG